MKSNCTKAKTDIINSLFSTKAVSDNMWQPIICYFIQLRLNDKAGHVFILARDFCNNKNNIAAAADGHKDTAAAVSGDSALWSIIQSRVRNYRRRQTDGAESRKRGGRKSGSHSCCRSLTQSNKAPAKGFSGILAVNHQNTRREYTVCTTEEEFPLIFCLCVISDHLICRLKWRRWSTAGHRSAPVRPHMQMTAEAICMCPC